MSKKRKNKIGAPSWTSNDVVMGWCLNDAQNVPAIEQSIITVVKCPVNYYQHFDYSPEVMALRSKTIVELGWDNTSFDLPRPPMVVGKYSLLSNAIKKVVSTLGRSDINAQRLYPSMIGFQPDEYRQDYCVLYFNHQAYEFYNLLFILGNDVCPFENVPNPKIKTLNQLLRWSKSFEFMRRKMYKSHGFSWEPKSEEL